MRDAAYILMCFAGQELLDTASIVFTVTCDGQTTTRAPVPDGPSERGCMK